jgi:A/G-specific adenine glycosylase
MAELIDRIEQPSHLITDLLAWYDEFAATLPWRNTPDPYRAWLSEIMLQQTQIATVTPYYARFLARFPTVEALAAAPLDDVLKAWEGLGYYSRARNLHRAAQQVTVSGQFPKNAAEWQTLPGIGRYTAGAIASMVYGEAVAALDGNAIRVLSRIADLSEDVTRPATIRDLWALAELLVPADRPGAYNQAIMDLGRTICTGRKPLCNKCPVAAYCQANQAGTQSQRPVKAARAPIPHQDVIAALIFNQNGEILISQRPVNGLLGGLWGLPGATLQPDETAVDCLRRALSITVETDPERLAIGEQMALVQHAFTHFRLSLHVHIAKWRTEAAPTVLGSADQRWVKLDQLDTFAFARADRRALDTLRKQGVLPDDASAPNFWQTAYNL